MKYLSSFLFFIYIAFSSTLAHADFFEEEMIGANPETALIQEIGINALSLSDSREMRRYNSAVYFVTSIKREAVSRFNDGIIPLYRRYDIITHLDSFVYTMNQHFLYQKRYEQTKRNVYKESAQSYLDDSK